MIKFPEIIIFFRVISLPENIITTIFNIKLFRRNRFPEKVTLLLRVIFPECNYILELYIFRKGYLSN